MVIFVRMAICNRFDLLKENLMQNAVRAAKGSQGVITQGVKSSLGLWLDSSAFFPNGFWHSCHFWYVFFRARLHCWSRAGTICLEVVTDLIVNVFRLSRRTKEITISRDGFSGPRRDWLGWSPLTRKLEQMPTTISSASGISILQRTFALAIRQPGLDWVTEEKAQDLQAMAVRFNKKSLV